MFSWIYLLELLFIMNKTIFLRIGGKSHNLHMNNYFHAVSTRRTEQIQLLRVP